MSMCKEGRFQLVRNSFAFIAGLALQISCLMGQSGIHSDKFNPLDEVFRSPGAQRNASGAPGPGYWQNEVDYDMVLSLDTRTHTLEGSAQVTYHNNSPDKLTYLWLRISPYKEGDVESSSIQPLMDANTLSRLSESATFAIQIDSMKNRFGGQMSFVKSGEHIMVDLKSGISSKEKLIFSVYWTLPLPPLTERTDFGYGSPYKGGASEYVLANFFPKVSVYNDIDGWLNQVSHGSSDYAHPFGNYKVSLELPQEYIVASTGELVNDFDVLTPDQFSRYADAKNANIPTYVIAPGEVKVGKHISKSKVKEWSFHADQVRDFAMICSPDFVWKAQQLEIGENRVMVETFYPPSEEDFWDTYSHELACHTIEEYSSQLFPFPYPRVVVANAGNPAGSSYPMLAVFGKTPRMSGKTLSLSTYRTMEELMNLVGQNYFPHIINSDETKWAWMDEGLSTYFTSRVAKSYDSNFPTLADISYVIPYMRTHTHKISPIMTHVSQVQFPQYNLSIKPAVALQILRETIMEEELFDRAIQEYARRWKFKNPSPEDFFRTMEDASGIDLDWFWRAWFYEVDPVDIELTSLRYFRMNAEGMPEESRDGPRFKFSYLSDESNPGESMPVPTFSTNDKELMRKLKDKHFYELAFRNKGGAVMPLIVEFIFEDGTKEVQKVPAEIWRKNDQFLRKVFVTDKKVDRVSLDPKGMTGDIESANNIWSWENPMNISHSTGTN